MPADHDTEPNRSIVPRSRWQNGHFEQLHFSSIYERRIRARHQSPTSVDAAFDYDEGEDDRALESWRRKHRNYVTRLGQFAEEMMLWCERSRVVQNCSHAFHAAGA